MAGFYCSWTRIRQDAHRTLDVRPVARAPSDRTNMERFCLCAQPATTLGGHGYPSLTEQGFGAVFLFRSELATAGGRRNSEHRRTKLRCCRSNVHPMVRSLWRTECWAQPRWRILGGSILVSICCTVAPDVGGRRIVAGQQRLRAPSRKYDT